MRIRKNAGLSSLLFSQGGLTSEVPPVYMCQLNQSPWDVIPIASLPVLELDGEEDCSFSGNGNWVDDPTGGDSGMDATMVVDDIQVPSSFNCNNNDNDDNDNDDSDVSKVMSLAVKSGACRKSNGKGWHCTRTPKEGHYLCDHHFRSQTIRNTNHSVSTAEKGVSPAGEVSILRRRGRPPKKAAAKSEKSSSNQFYYYSGFGPLWGKQRNDKGTVAVAEDWESPVEENTTPTPTSPYSFQIDGGDDMEYEESSEDDSSSCDGRKRIRKPVKARSLKSLM